MNKKNIERKTLFLYPSPEELNEEKDLFDILHLISDISKICHISNEVIGKIMSSGCFSSIRCKPNVSLKCVEEYNDSKFECENVRICITKYCGKDYTSYYKNVINDFKNNKSDISHLVAINIGEVKKTYFHPDDQDNFDAVIETNLESLDLILEAIMLDIALYHYFNLKDDLESRKKFNSYKWEYITNNFSDEEKKLFFGSTPPTRSYYLPFSLPHLKKYNSQKNANTLKMTIDDLIKRYGFFVSTKVSLKLLYNDNCSLRPIDIPNLKYDIFSDFLFKNPTASKLISEKKSFVVFFFYVNSIDFKDGYVLELNIEGFDVSEWLQRINEGLQSSMYLLCADKGGC